LRQLRVAVVPCDPSLPHRFAESHSIHLREFGRFAEGERSLSIERDGEFGPEPLRNFRLGNAEAHEHRVRDIQGHPHAPTIAPSRSHAPPVGLCAACAHVKTIRSDRGAVFYLCKLSAGDPHFPKYPRLPVRSCAGYEDCTMGRSMPDLIEKPTIIAAAGTLPKRIAEYVGRVNSATEAVSIARMESPAGWSEPGQTPEFDEYTVVLRGLLRVETRSGTIDVKAGQAIAAHRGEWVRYSTPEPGGAEYIAVCIPAFSPELVHREPS